MRARLLLLVLALIGVHSTAYAQEHHPFNCHSAHGNAELCHRAAFHGCAWTDGSHQCNKVQLCSDHLTQGACTLDWSCRWWGRCQPTIPGDITSLTADALCTGLNYNTETAFYDRMQNCMGYTQCEWDHASLQCKTDRNYYAFSGSITEGRCLQDGNAVWHRPVDSRCYDPLHPGMHEQPGHADHVICPPGNCYPRGRCDPAVICDAVDSSTCNSRTGNCKWDAATGRCKAERRNSLSHSRLQRWCHDALDYSLQFTNLRNIDIGPRVCPAETAGAGLANCTIKSDCLRKRKADVCSYKESDNACFPNAEIVCSEIKCPSMCVAGTSGINCAWAADVGKCAVGSALPPPPPPPPSPSAGSTGGAARDDSSGRADDGGDGGNDDAMLLRKLDFRSWHFDHTASQILGDIYVSLRWACLDPRTPIFVVGNSSEAVNGESWNCTSVTKRIPHFPTHVPCSDPYRLYFNRMVATLNDFLLDNQTVYQPLNPSGIVTAVDIVEHGTDDLSDDLLRYSLRLDLHEHILKDNCVGDISDLVQKDHISVGPASFVDFLTPLSYTETDRNGRTTAVEMMVHTVLYHNNDTVNYVEPAVPAPLNRPDREPNIRFSLMQAGFASTAAYASPCEAAHMKAVQVVYALELTGIPAGVTAGPRFLTDIGVTSPCHGMHIFKVVPVGCSDAGATCLFYLVLRSECRSATHGNLTWSHCGATETVADPLTAGTIEVDLHVQLWQCLGSIPLQTFVGHFWDEDFVCMPQTTRYAHGSVMVGADAIWTTNPRRFDINMALLRSPKSTTDDILLELSKTDGAGLPVPARSVLTDTSFNLAVFFDNAIVRDTVGLSIIPDSVAIIGINAAGKELQPQLHMRDLLSAMTVFPKKLLQADSPTALRLEACTPFAGCDGFVVPTRLLKYHLPDAAYYRVALSCALSTGQNVSTAFSSSLASLPPSLSVQQLSPAGRRLLQVNNASSSTAASGSSSTGSGSSVNSSSSSTGGSSANHTTSSSSSSTGTAANETLLSSSSTGIDSNTTANTTADDTEDTVIIEEIVLVETVVVIDLSALEESERKRRADDVMLIIFYVVLALLLVSACILAGYFWWGRTEDMTNAPFVLKSQPVYAGGQHVSALQGVGAHAALPTLQPRSGQRRTGHGTYSALSSVEQ